MLDDPVRYGQAAAANSLSDAYAMGATPVAVLNTLNCPASLDPQVLGAIMRGGAEKIHEAGAVVAGGHSVDDEYINYGFAVTATVHPDRVVKNDGARPGDALVLTKPLGIGLLTTAVKKGILPDDVADRVGAVMGRLNRAASEAMVAAGAHACTDITGFGLVGHARNVAASSGVTFELSAGALPALPEWRHFHGKGCMSGGSKRNKEAAAAYLDVAPGVEGPLVDLAVDAQTSGGLLIAIDPAKADDLVARCRGAGNPEATVVGRVLPRAGDRLVRLVP